MNGVSPGPRRYEIQYQIVSHADRADRHEHPERTQGETRAREAPLQEFLARARVRSRHSGKVDNERSR